MHAEPEHFYDNYNKHYIDKLNTSQPIKNMHHMPWPVINNDETPPQLPNSRQITTATTTNCSSDNHPAESGMGTLGL